MRNAFSLVELSIVLVILGLLTGGILAGQSLIRASELRAVSTEANRYHTAIMSFRDKYFQLPGDISNATKFWGTAANCPGAYNQGSTTATTCDGDGNGLIDFRGSYSAPTENETFRFWQHLANAGLIEGQYSGVTTSTTGYFLGVGSTNVPSSKLNSALWAAVSANNSSGSWSGAWFNYDYKLLLHMGGLQSENANNAAVLAPEEAWNIDTKMDDGRPGRGKVTALVGSACTNAATGADYNADFVLTDRSKRCILNVTI